MKIRLVIGICRNSLKELPYKDMLLEIELIVFAKLYLQNCICKIVFAKLYLQSCTCKVVLAKLYL